ncbi:MAG: Sbm protein [Acidimicrobiaceae bacterium]|nr:Sbm protein [Acidimicrobiaceae bacterium]
MRPVRIVLAKPGLDGHDRGVKVIGMALRDAGAEVVYLGLRRTPLEIARAAIDERADAVGISILSGAHVALAEQLLAARESAGASVPYVIGGTIPRGDVGLLVAIGIADVLPVGTPLAEVVDRLLRVASEPVEVR